MCFYHYAHDSGKPHWTSRNMQKQWCTISFVFLQVEKLEVVNKRYVRVIFTPGQTSNEAVSEFFHLPVCTELNETFLFVSMSSS